MHSGNHFETVRLETRTPTMRKKLMLCTYYVIKLPFL